MSFYSEFAYGPGLPPHEVEKAESSSKNAEESGNKN